MKKPKIVVCSGAGLSVASGLPTFRCQNGLWEQYDLDKVCNLPKFLENYIECNEFYAARREQLKKVAPNAAHIGLSQAQRDLADVVDMVHFTTNVDDLLEQAGCQNVIHVHGNLKQLVTKWNTPEAQIVDADTVQWDDPTLYPVKPNVVFFGEIAPVYQQLAEALTSLTSDDFVFIIGSSEQVVHFGYQAKNYPQQHNRPHVFYVGPELPYACWFDTWINKKAEELDYTKIFKTLVDSESE